MSSDLRFIIPMLQHPGDLLRIPHAMVAELDLTAPATVRAQLPSGRSLPVRINPIDRTLTGLGPWFRQTRCSDDQVAVCVTVTSKDPLAVSVDYTDEQTPSHDAYQRIERPAEELYVGARLASDFFELVQTNEAMSLAEEDLVRHVFICGTSGSGKTVLAKVLIEEAAQKGIPVIAVDLKGDISSMTLTASGDDPEEIAPWISTRRGEVLEEKAAEVAGRHRTNLDRWGISSHDVREFQKRVAVNVFTPRSNSGFRLALSAFVEPPSDLEDLRASDPDAYEDVIQFMAETFVGRLNLSEGVSTKAKGYVYEIIRLFWDRNIDLRGYDGIVRVLEEVRSGSNQIEQIGSMPTDEYIDNRDRKKIADAINTLLIGAQKLWFQGFPLNVEELLDRDNFNNKTPVSIINIKHLSFSDQAYVVGYLSYLIWFWMRRREGSEGPRLLYYIDEIGGGGSKEAFFHSVAKSPAKPALNLLIRQGRAFGVCCMFATQSPADIDYKALGQCGTWMVGQLRTQRERQKIKDGAGIADLDFERASQHLPHLRTGQFVVKPPSDSWGLLQERWLMHQHRVLSETDLKKWKAAYEDEAASVYSEAREHYDLSRLGQAKALLEDLIGRYPFSTQFAKAHLLLATIFFDLSQYEDAAGTCERLLKSCIDAEETGDAYFLLGRCYEQLERVQDAVASFSRTIESGAKDEIKNQAANHLDYCKSRLEWAELSDVGKFAWWVLGKSPDSNKMIRLEADDKTLISTVIVAVLGQTDFEFPEVFDLGQILKHHECIKLQGMAMSAERTVAERWIREQLPRAKEFLRSEQHQEAAFLAQKILNRIKDNSLVVPASVIDLLRQCNEWSEQKRQESRLRVIQLQAKEFEFEVANLFRAKGYEALVTRMSRDDGVDVFAKKDGEKVLIQCKRWQRPISRAAVDEFAGVRSRSGMPRAILATTSSFSEDARRVAQDNGIELWDFTRLAREWKMTKSAGH